MDTVKYKPFWSKKEVRELFKHYALKARSDLNFTGDKVFDVYELPDGKILFVLGYGNGTGTMYRSAEELRRLMKEPDVRKPGEHVLSNLIPDDRKFLKEQANYIRSLSVKLNIPIEKFDRTLKSLKTIDSAYKKRPPHDKFEFFNKDYLYLIAYLGEVYKKEVGGEWYFEREVNVESYIPYIKLRNGEELDPYFRLFKECYEYYENFCIYCIADVQVRIGLSSR